MDTAKFNDDLWDDIPAYAFMALGRRGREEIALTQCFIPKCEGKGEDKLHPIEKIVEILPKTEKQLPIQKTKFKIYCDCCKQTFHLVFEKHLSPETEKVEDDDYNNAILLERVYASDNEDKTDYGEIGFVQPK